jgi:hypothetical protein
VLELIWRGLDRTRRAGGVVVLDEFQNEKLSMVRRRVSRAMGVL